VPLWHHAERAKVPAAKSVPVRVVRGGAADGAGRTETPVMSDLVSGSLLADAAADVTRAVGLAGRLAWRGLKREPVKAAVAVLALGMVVGALQMRNGATRPE
jgi:hypothetical protein